MNTPHNRLATTRDSGGRFAKGVTGNPGGRPKGLASYIRDRTSDGQDLVDKVVHILQHPNGKGIQAQKLQLECIQWLADRGFGKAVLNVEHTGQIGHAIDVFAGMSTEELKALHESMQAVVALKAQVIEGEARAIE